MALNDTVLPADMKNGGKIDVNGEQLAVSSVIVELEKFVIWYSTVATGMATQLTVTFVTLLAATVPEPFETVHVSPEGLVATVTL